MALHDVVITNHGSRGSDDAETYRLVAEHDIIPSLVAALRAVLDVTLAARFHPGSLRCQFAEDVEAAIAATLEGVS